MLRFIGYWALVFVVSAALVLGVLLLLESRDAPSLETGNDSDHASLAVARW